MFIYLIIICLISCVFIFSIYYLSEVLSDADTTSENINRKRLRFDIFVSIHSYLSSIGGWFHGPPIERPVPSLEPLPISKPAQVIMIATVI